MMLWPGGQQGNEAQSPDAALASFILGLRAKGIRDKGLLIAFETTPRLAFLPGINPNLVYASYALPLGCGAEATAPHTIAQVVGALNLKPGMKVLEIGTGSGFQAAVLARYGCQVVTLERYRTLHLNAARAMKRLSVVNVRLEHGDGLEGFESAAPYDRIIVNAALADVPDALVEQLAEGGMIAAPVRLGPDQRLYVFEDIGENFSQRDLGRSAFQALIPGVAAAL